GTRGKARQRRRGAQTRRAQGSAAAHGGPIARRGNRSAHADVGRDRDGARPPAASSPQHQQDSRSRPQIVGSGHASLQQRQPGGPGMTALPAPEQWVLAPMTELKLAEEIEKHVEFVDKTGRSVRLPSVFVRAFLTRDDDLPMVVAIATMPIILADGAVLALPDDNDIDLDRGIEFHIQPEVMATVPQREDCTPAAVWEAMQFLTDEWLCDVATDYDGKCTLIAAALTLIERSLLPQRPTFFVTGGKRGSGKTTTLTMLIVAVTGIWPSAAAWSKNEEERRKAIFSYFLYGVPYILWDNIERGAQITCP